MTFPFYKGIVLREYDVILLLIKKYVGCRLLFLEVKENGFMEYIRVDMRWVY